MHLLAMHYCTTRIKPHFRSYVALPSNQPWLAITPCMDLKGPIILQKKLSTTNISRKLRVLGWVFGAIISIFNHKFIWIFIFIRAGRDQNIESHEIAGFEWSINCCPFNLRVNFLHVLLIEHVLDSGCVLFCAVGVERRTREVPASDCIWFRFALYIWFYSLSQAVAGSELTRSRSRSKTVMNRTRPCLMFQTLLLCSCCSSHMDFLYDNSCLPHFLYPQCDSPYFMCPKLTDNDSPSLILCGQLVLADAWLLFLVLFSSAMSKTMITSVLMKLDVGD